MNNFSILATRNNAIQEGIVCRRCSEISIEDIEVSSQLSKPTSSRGQAESNRMSWEDWGFPLEEVSKGGQRKVVITTADK